LEEEMIQISGGALCGSDNRHKACSKESIIVVDPDAGRFRPVNKDEGLPMLRLSPRVRAYHALCAEIRCSEIDMKKVAEIVQTYPWARKAANLTCSQQDLERLSVATRAYIASKLPGVIMADESAT